jgi:hypothetical protein
VTEYTCKKITDEFFNWIFPKNEITKYEKQNIQEFNMLYALILDSIDKSPDYAFHSWIKPLIIISEKHIKNHKKVFQFVEQVFSNMFDYTCDKNLLFLNYKQNKGRD